MMVVAGTLVLIIINVIVKAVFIPSIMLMALIQYGYYFGLKEELQYWDIIATEIQKNNTKIIENKIVVSDVHKKNNHH